MTRRPPRERLIAFAAGELSPDDRQAIDDLLVEDERFRKEAAVTLGNCRFLADRLGRLRDLVHLDTGLPEAPASPAVAAKARPAPPNRILLSGALLLAAAAGAYLLYPSGTPEEAPEAATSRAAVRPGAGGETVPRETKPPAAEAPTAEPEPEVVKPVERPTAIPVKPGVSMLLPRLIKTPVQANLERVWEALRERPAEVSAVTLRLPRVEDEGKRAALVLVLAALNDDRNVQSILVDVLDTDGSALVRRAAAGALGHVRGLRGEKVPTTASLSVRAGRILVPERRELLLRAAERERDPGVLAVLVRMMGPSRGQDRAIADRLFELARSKNDSLRRAAISALGSGDGGDLQAISELIRDTEIPARDRAPLVVRLARAADGLSRLEYLIDASPEPEIRLAAVRALPAVVKKGYVSVAVELLRNSRETREIRLAALGVLGREMGHTAAKAAVKAAAGGDEDEAVRTAARELLRTLDPEKK